jgi:uncharacterized protein YcbX
MITLTAISIYPVKSLGGFSLTEALVQERGLQYDRRWMLIDEDGLFISQRAFHHLALAKTQIENDVLTISDSRGILPVLKLDVSQMEPESKQVQVWDDNLQAALVSTLSDEWFSDFLSKKVRLVAISEQSQRPADPKYVDETIQVSFADGYPYLLIGSESLQDLNSKLDSPVPMDRFRPNFVTEGAIPFAEDNWKLIRIGKLRFKLVKPCARCVMTTIDQNSGKASKEPLKTLSEYRKVGSKVLFGQNLIALDYGKVSVGDRIEILE